MHQPEDDIKVRHHFAGQCRCFKYNTDTIQEMIGGDREREASLVFASGGSMNLLKKFVDLVKRELVMRDSGASYERVSPIALKRKKKTWRWRGT